jgi:hypothetical protein
MMKPQQILLFKWRAPGLCGPKGFNLEAPWKRQIEDEAPAGLAF